MAAASRPASRTVWAVRLGTGGDDVPGTLSLEMDAVLFTMETAELRIELADINRAKRNRGSPILIVRHHSDGESASHAFFFSQPPPLKPPEGKSKRKNARRSIVYLQTQNRDLKPIVVEWERAINEAMRSG